MTIQPWQKRREAIVFAGYRGISRKTFVLPNGVEAEFEIKPEPRSESKERKSKRLLNELALAGEPFSVGSKTKPT